MNPGLLVVSCLLCVTLLASTRTARSSMLPAPVRYTRDLFWGDLYANITYRSDGYRQALPHLPRFRHCRVPQQRFHSLQGALQHPRGSDYRPVRSIHPSVSWPMPNIHPVVLSVTPDSLNSLRSLLTLASLTTPKRISSSRPVPGRRSCRSSLALPPQTRRPWSRLSLPRPSSRTRPRSSTSSVVCAGSEPSLMSR